MSNVRNGSKLSGKQNTKTEHDGDDEDSDIDE